MAIRRIAFILIDGYALMSTAAAIEPLRAASLFQQDLYECRILSVRGAEARASVGAVFAAKPIEKADFSDDLVFVVAGEDPFALQEPALADWLRGADRSGVKLGGISGGAAILAQAGLMTNRRFTIHWRHFEQMRAQSERYLLERRLFVIDRDRYTCAGGSAPLDMMHAIIARDHGAAFARRISSWFIQTDVRSAEAPQQSALVERAAAAPKAVRETLELMETHIADPLSLAQLAELVGLSARQLERQFRESLDAAVMSLYRDARLEVARDLLRRSTLSVADIAEATGFSGPAHFSQAFRRRFDAAPSAMRKIDAQDHDRGGA